jgi:hypothetical protein
MPGMGRVLGGRGAGRTSSPRGPGKSSHRSTVRKTRRLGEGILHHAGRRLMDVTGAHDAFRGLALHAKQNSDPNISASGGYVDENHSLAARSVINATDMQPHEVAGVGTALGIAGSVLAFSSSAPALAAIALLGTTAYAISVLSNESQGGAWIRQGAYSMAMEAELQEMFTNPDFTSDDIKRSFEKLVTLQRLLTINSGFFEKFEMSPTDTKMMKFYRGRVFRMIEGFLSDGTNNFDEALDQFLVIKDALSEYPEIAYLDPYRE